jgi:dienelactone hydrolase
MRWIFLSFCIASTACLGQTSFYETFPIGPLPIGYQTFVLYDSSASYSEYEYSGVRPIFGQEWHPCHELDAPGLTYADFRTRTLSPSLIPPYQALVAHMNNAFIEYDLAHEYTNWDILNYNDPITEVQEIVQGLPTLSHACSQSPDIGEIKGVVVYHHGAQGLSDENYLLAELLASHGYVFLSANFHWAYEGFGYGSGPFLGHDASALQRLIRRAQSQYANKPIFFIGHSWGAQMGWLYLENEPINGFISLETTLEFKKDDNVIAEYWPEMHKKLTNELPSYNFPILSMANTQSDQVFSLFAPFGRPAYHVSAKADFGHECYTSIFLMRTLFYHRIFQPDTEVMRRQINLYHHHARFILAALDAWSTGQSFDTSQFEDDFFISPCGDSK